MSNNASGTGRVFNLTGASGDMAASVYDPNGNREDVFAYATRVAKAAVDQVYEDLLKDGAMYQTLTDSTGTAIQDSTGEDISARLLFNIK